MIIIGRDFHTPYQQIAMANDETGEVLLEWPGCPRTPAKFALTLQGRATRPG